MKFTFFTRFFIVLMLMAPAVQIIQAQEIAGWQQFADEKNAFRLMVPAEPVKGNKADSSAEWHIDNYTCFDMEHQVMFMFSIRSIKEGYYLPGDSIYFESQKENWDKMSKYNLQLEFFKKGNLPAMRYEMMMENEEGELVMKTITINRGNRSYLLLAATDEANAKSPAIEYFFNSFEAIDYLPGKWKINSSADQVFSAYTPAPITASNLSEETGGEPRWVYYSYDSLTAVTYEVQKVSFVDYYHAKNDSMVFENALATLQGYSDSVISKRAMVNGADPSLEVLLAMPNSQTVRRMRLVWHGDTVYAAYAFLSPELRNQSSVNRYFNEWKVLLPPAKTTLLTSKTKEFFADLSSADTAKFKKAAAAISEISFEKEDLPLLKEAFTKKYAISENENYNLYNTIADLVYDLHQTANDNNANILSLVKNNYFSAKVYNDAQPLAMLRLLAKVKTKESYTLLKELLLAKQPQSESLYSLSSIITDSLELAAGLFPDVLKLSANPLYYDVTASVANELLDTGMIQKSMVTPYLANYYKATASLIDTLKVNKDPNVWMYNDFLHLIGRMNMPEGNQWLQKVLKQNNLYLNKYIAIDLLQNKQKVDPKVLEAIAASNDERASLYYLLKEKKLLSFFPVKYSTQKFMAESDAYAMASEEDDLQKLSFVAVKIADTKNGKKKFYLFKAKFEDGEYLVISGGYELNEKILLVKPEHEMGGLYADELFNVKKIDEQFKTYLKQMNEE